MNYGHYIKYKINVFFFVVRSFRKLTNISKVFRCLGDIVYNELLFWISDSDSVYLTLYGNMVQNIFTTCFRFFSKNVPEVWTVFVRNIWGGFVWDFWSPYVAEASRGRGYNVAEASLGRDKYIFGFVYLFLGG